MYLDISSIVHNNLFLNNILENKIIYDSSFSNNDSYIIFTDGTMICYGRRSCTVSNTVQVGQVFYTDALQLGNFTASFISTPSCVFFTESGSLNPIEHNSLSKTGLDYFWLWNPTKRSNVNAVISYIALGKWK